jgi:hypothetical protein
MEHSEHPAPTSNEALYPSAHDMELMATQLNALVDRMDLEFEQGHDVSVASARELSAMRFQAEAMLTGKLR